MLDKNNVFAKLKQTGHSAMAAQVLWEDLVWVRIPVPRPDETFLKKIRPAFSKSDTINFFLPLKLNAR